MSELLAERAGGEREAPVERTPIWGTPTDRWTASRAFLCSLGLTGLYVAVASRTSAGTPGWLEIVGTVTSLTCVWITRRQNVLCMPIGLLGVFATAAFFFEIDLVGQAWLNLAYYLPIQIIGWWMWIRYGVDRTDRPVTWMSNRERGRVALGVLAGTVLLTVGFRALHGPSDTLLWDCSIVAASVAAQWLLTLKRIESWWLWLIPVDVSAIALYVVSGAYLFGALYVVYLVLASLGLRDWARASRAQRAGLTPFEARLR